MKPPILRRIVPSANLAALAPAQVTREFRRLVDRGAKLRCHGECHADPARLLSKGYTPKYKIELFETTFYFTNVRQNPAIRFLVAYVVQKNTISPRIFYKDLSLIWRVISHLIAEDDEFWIGKGDVRTVIEGGLEVTDTIESTTDLPFEIQTAMEAVNRKGTRVRMDEEALYLVLRRAPAGRIVPYSDFTGPRARAAQDKRNLIHGGRSIARFTRKNDPTSLKIVSGYEPDFKSGIVEVSEGRSAMYGGALERYRILSKNQLIQYIFMAAPKHVWIIPPQATTVELSSFGVRTVDVVADDDLFIPGFEYHYFDPGDDPSEHFTQIPEGFAGASNDHDPDRADASAWLDEIPVIREFTQKVLGR